MRSMPALHAAILSLNPEQPASTLLSCLDISAKYCHPDDKIHRGWTALPPNFRSRSHPKRKREIDMTWLILAQPQLHGILAYSSNWLQNSLNSNFTFYSNKQTKAIILDNYFLLQSSCSTKEPPLPPLFHPLSPSVFHRQIQKIHIM